VLRAEIAAASKPVNAGPPMSSALTQRRVGVVVDAGGGELAALPADVDGNSRLRR
jgi:hypothetical protein